MAMITKQVFAVWGSPCGGKTTLAANMAVILADSGYMTCLVSASDHGELQAFFNDQIPHDKGLYAAISNGRNVRDSLVETRPNLCLLELDTGGDAYDIANITDTQVKNIIDDLREQFSYVIIDCTNYKESVFTGVGLVEADKVVLCVPHRTTAATWHFANTQMIDALSSKVMYVDVDNREGGTNLVQLFASIGIKQCDISIPYVDAAYDCENYGTPIVLKGSTQARRYKARVLQVIKALLEIASEEKAEAERARKGEKADKKHHSKHKGSDNVGVLFDDRSESRKRMDEPNFDTGIHAKPMSARERRKAEEEMMRRARETLEP